ncbi:glycosyl hydrolase 115 family protein [Alkalitalea saponilacus]|uniref:Glycosyl hydrolase family 115 n=1 Tax=Alkalitalea saponilacus TaxID=889453 RepID=A0A1T5E613_9BACT|nr:glycosyl hydrolase 115 family protein [Alkalitalea saponilacus]ASB49099.1 glycosyl hydrolase [Alkalitalea saponilacus]SKB79319.1 Glycosyl hydrolase family 115 [Alkalitalea saponilacus]
MKLLSTILLIGMLTCSVFAGMAENNSYVFEEKGEAFFVLSDMEYTASLLINSDDSPSVTRAFGDLQEDIYRVTGRKPELKYDEVSTAKYAVIAGTLGQSKLIDDLVNRGHIDKQELEGKWEKFIIKTVENPLPGIENALVIAGSDRRGTVFGIYDVSEKIGVSPWYYWADVPIKKKNQIYIKPGTYTDGEPVVKYRGIFINDEAPALRNWAIENFGGLNHKFYSTVYELLLRSKANFLWPAMWLPSMFYVDDPLNPKVADEYGIVISTTHHEPMMRAHNEWNHFYGGEWNYETNKENLREFWREGVERIGDYETFVTVGMRGDGDLAMTDETATELLETIIADQREIIADVTGKPASETPQLWAIYKEVQDYWDQGMRVDDDILILLCNDNWGNVSLLPKEHELDHKAGFGMYYHFNYVGAPVSYRWHNVTQIERVWEQMKITYDFGVKELWLVNVGDIKPMEFPISFFLDFAWNPEAIQAGDLPNYYINWAERKFGDTHKHDIAELIALYTKYNARRTHEMLSPETYSIENYREADRIINDFRLLLERSKEIYEQMPETHKSAFYQLVLSPIEMSSNLNELYVTAAKNRLYALQGRASTNIYVDKVRDLFFKDDELTRQFHEDLEDGKWNHMMSQNRIGYTSWNHPRANIMPAVSYIHIPNKPKLGFEVEYGSEAVWAGFSIEGEPTFSDSFSEFDPYNQQEYYVDIFNMGEGRLIYSVEAKNDWINLSGTGGSIEFDERVYVSIDWEKVPDGNPVGEIMIKGAGQEHQVKIPVRNELPKASGFVENNGVVSIGAANFTNKFDSEELCWTVVPNLGRESSSIIVEPFNSPTQTLSENSPMVEYEFTVFDAGEITVEAYLSPTQDFKKQGGLKFAISINDEKPQIINMNEGEIVPDYKYADWWMQSVGNQIKIKTSRHHINEPGKQTLKLWVVDTGIVFQKFVIDAGGLRESYLGPPESKYIGR